MKLIKIDGYWIIVEKQIPNIDEFYWDDLVSSWKNVGILKMNGYADGNSTKKVISSYVGTTTPIQCSNRLIASNNPEHNLPSITFSEEVVKELGEVDIEKIATDYYQSASDSVIDGFIDGYNQCKEDNKENKYTDKNIINSKSIIDSYFKVKPIEHFGLNIGDMLEHLVASLNAKIFNKQDYEVEIEIEHCEYCGGDGIFIDGDNNRLKCPACPIPDVTNNSITIIKLLK